MASVAKDKHLKVADERARLEPTAAAPAVQAPVAASALTIPGLGLGGFGIQRKLTVGDAKDPAEVAADRVAHSVVTALHGAGAASGVAAPARSEAVPDPREREVGLAGGALSPELNSAIASARGRGSALPGPIRRDMESVLGADLSGVRVHSGPGVADLASRISARAFTVGSDVFIPQSPDTASPAGTHLLAHELAHVVANTSAPSRSPASVGSPVGRSVIRRNEKSEKALADLATPIIQPGPEVKVQTALVEKIEATIPKMAKDRKEAEKKLSKWNEGFDEREVSAEQKQKHTEEYNRRFEEIKKKYPDMDLQEIYLGSIVLDGIPPKENEKNLYKAELAPTDNAMSTMSYGLRLVEVSGTEELIVRNTISTMISAGQIDYLRKAGFVGGGWRVIVEIHYIRNRPASAASMHKDTKGQTMFVNLNYTNSEEMAGPEFVINPPLQAEHEEVIEQNLPGEFMRDLKHVRKRVGQPTLIRTGTVAPHGVVSFVDEAIHHSTPLIGHREVSAKNVRLFLENEQPFRAHYRAALTAWDRMKQNSDDGREAFGDVFKGVSEKEKSAWEALLSLTDGDDKKKLARPVLMKAGLSEDDVDRLLSQYGPEAFNSASIPEVARRGGRARAPFDTDEPGRKVVLKREMSQKALQGKLPPVAAKNEEVKEGFLAGNGARRAFFRTWVRAVRVDPREQQAVKGKNTGVGGFLSSIFG